MDEMLDGLTFINKSIQTGDAIPPRFFGLDADEPDEPAELDSVLDQIRKPTTPKHRGTSRKADVPAA